MMDGGNKELRHIKLLGELLGCVLLRSYPQSLVQCLALNSENAGNAGEFFPSSKQ